MKKAARICIVHGGHLSTCPRMLKAADAFVDAGHKVRVVSMTYMDWARDADKDVLARRHGRWQWTEVRYEKGTPSYHFRRARYHAAIKAAHALGESAPMSIVARAFGRFHSELVAAAVTEPCDLVYAATSGALAAGKVIATKLGVPYAIDLEDHHSSDEPDTADGRRRNRIAARIEQWVVPDAAFVTTASQGLSDLYFRDLGRSPIVVHNTFPLPANEPDFSSTPSAPLKLYWFSQTIGHARGLEDVVRAIGLAQIDAELHLRGNTNSDYLASLQRLVAVEARQLKLFHHAPAPPDDMVALCHGYDIGLSIERGSNRAFTITNKGLTYILAGLALVFNDTPGQRPLARDVAEGGVVVPSGELSTLAHALRRWSDDRALLTRAKRKAWAAARARWHWEHPLERGALLHALDAALPA